MASLKERLQDTCTCGHRGAEHAALDRGTHIALEACTHTEPRTPDGGPCDREGLDEPTRCHCTQFRRIPGPTERAGKQSLRAHGQYAKKRFRV